MRISGCQSQHQHGSLLSLLRPVVGRCHTEQVRPVGSRRMRDRVVVVWHAHKRSRVISQAEAELRLNCLHSWLQAREAHWMQKLGSSTRQRTWTRRRAPRCRAAAAAAPPTPAAPAWQRPCSRVQGIERCVAKAVRSPTALQSVFKLDSSNSGLHIRSPLQQHDIRRGAWCPLTQRRRLGSDAAAFWWRGPSVNGREGRQLAGHG
jgi:hypothetical protein